MTLLSPVGRPIRLILATAAILLATMSPAVRAQANESGVEAQAILPPANALLTGRTLKVSLFETNSTGINANCGTSGCQATKALFPVPSALCAGPIGQTCTFYILLESANQISASDQGLYRFLVDGVAPTPGPTGSTGFYKFVESNPNSDATQSGSFAVVATVKNTTLNQHHPVAVSFGCKDDTGDGCFAFAAMSSLRVDVFQP